MPDLLGLSDFPLGNKRVYDNAIAVKSMVAVAVLFLIWSNWIPRKFLLILWINLSFYAAYFLWISGISVDLGKSNLKFGFHHISINLAIFAEKLQLQMTYMCEANKIRPKKYAVSHNGERVYQLELAKIGQIRTLFVISEIKEFPALVC